MIDLGGRSTPRGMKESILTSYNDRCWWKKHTINDVSNSIGGNIVRSSHSLEISAEEAWSNLNSATKHCHVQRLALHGGDCLEWVQVSGQHPLWEDVVGQDVNQFLLVLWLHQAVQDSSRESVECIVCWSKNCKFLRCITQCVDQVCPDQCSCQDAQIG